MAPHQERVIAERDELSEKLDKLRTFLTSMIFTSLPRDEQRRLTRQTLIMSDYLDVLDERIAAF